MKSGMVKRMLAAALAATLIVTSAGTMNVRAAENEVSASVSVEQEEESTENVKATGSSVVYLDDMESETDDEWTIAWETEDENSAESRAKNQWAKNNQTTWWSFKTTDANTVWKFWQCKKGKGQ